MTNRPREAPGMLFPKKSLLMVSLGCAKNLVDSENMCQTVSDAGIALVQDPLSADIIVVNTCGFIESAKKEAIDKILEMAQYKETVTRFLIVTGCLAQRYSKEIQQLIPEVDAVLGTAAYDRLLDTIEELYGRQEKPGIPCAVLPPVVHTEGKGSLRHLSTNRTPTTQGYAYIKIAEGCFNRCAYCAIPDIRGTMQSRSMEDLVEEASNLAMHGIYEVVLIAQDTTSYGLDLYGYPALPALIRLVSGIASIRTIRILYCYAEGITEELIGEMQSNPKVAHYIEMPIQHSNNAVLKRMNRRDTKQKITKVIHLLRKSIPDIVIRTTVMVGFA
jgi:ribosomal protein S12 methylthiotransferase